MNFKTKILKKQRYIKTDIGKKILSHRVNQADIIGFETEFGWVAEIAEPLHWLSCSKYTVLPFHLLEIITS